MGWDIVNTVKNVATGGIAGQAENIVKDPYRAARSAATLGLSETPLGEEATKLTDKLKGLDPTKKVKADTGAIDAATQSATSWQDEIKKRMAGQTGVTAQVAPVVNVEKAPVVSGTIKDVQASSVGTPQQVVAGPAVGNIAGQVGTVNTGAVQQAGTNVNEAMNLAQQAATGAAPSFAEMLIKKNAENQIKQQMAAQGGRAYDAAANRNIANKSIEIGQAAGTEAAGIRAQEMAAARGQYADIATSNRNQMMQMSMADATNQLSALSADQQAQVNQRAQNLQASGMNAENALKAAMADQQTATQVAVANQNVAAQTALADQSVFAQQAGQQAQLQQQRNLANIEADLKAKGMTQDQINFYLSQITGIEQSKMGGAQAASGLASNAAATTAANRAGVFNSLLGGISSVGAAAVKGG